MPRRLISHLPNAQILPIPFFPIQLFGSKYPPRLTLVAELPLLPGVIRRLGLTRLPYSLKPAEQQAIRCRILGVWIAPGPASLIPGLPPVRQSPTPSMLTHADS